MQKSPLLSALLAGINLPSLEGRLASSPVDPKEMRVYEASPNEWFLMDDAGATWAVIYDPELAALLAHAQEDLAILVENIRAIRKELEREHALEEFLACSDLSAQRERYDVPLSDKDAERLAAEASSAPSSPIPQMLAAGGRYTGKKDPQQVREIVALIPQSQHVQYRVVQGPQKGCVRVCSIAWFIKWAKARIA